MSTTKFPQTELLKKIGINGLNDMQQSAAKAIQEHDDVVLLSPTGSGKTLAFLLPLLEKLDPNNKDIQLLILVPSRELAIQIEQVIRNLGSGFKTNAVYGGQSFNQDKINLKHPPAILVGTPGRVSDHFKRGTFNIDNIHYLVLDEFDKSLEIGFEAEMRAIIHSLHHLEKHILTSATQKVDIPAFVGLQNEVTLSFSEKIEHLQIKRVVSEDKNKTEKLISLLDHLNQQRGIIFCNFKDSIQRLSDLLEERSIRHVCFFGGLEQQERERALVKFRNGTAQLIVATDLAARGLDIPQLDFIIHYEVSPKEDEFIHRNGRTARMNEKGTAYVLHSKNQRIPKFIQDLALDEASFDEANSEIDVPKWETLMISGGRRDKISKGDIAGFFFKLGHLNKEDLGVIELKENCAFVAVAKDKSAALIRALDNQKIKHRKVRIKKV